MIKFIVTGNTEGSRYANYNKIGRIVILHGPSIDVHNDIFALP